MQEVIGATIERGANRMSRQNLIGHLVLPSIAPAALIGLSFTPNSISGRERRLG